MNAQSRQHTDYHLTREAAERFRRELADLVERRRPQVAAEVARTSEMGDRSENAAYQIAKAQLTRMNTRILTLEDRLKHAVIIARGADQFGRVAIGATVTVTSDGRTQTFEILGSQETNPGRGRISHHAPLGVALMGRGVGDSVVVTVRGKATMYRIDRVA